MIRKRYKYDSGDIKRTVEGGHEKTPPTPDRGPIEKFSGGIFQKWVPEEGRKDMADIWYDIPGFEKYSINKSGEIKNKKTGKSLSKEINNGYERVKLWSNGSRKQKKVHRLLAEVFIPNPNGYPQINHKDGNKLNNSLDNLEWCTCRHNIRHALDNGLIVRGPNPNAGRSHRPVRIVETGKEYESMSACARSINGDPNKIQDCLSGRQRTHRGYHFEDVV